MAKLRIGPILVVLGIISMAFGALYPMVTVIVGGAAGSYTSIPKDGGIYSSLTTISIDIPEKSDKVAHPQGFSVGYYQDSLPRKALSTGYLADTIYTGNQPNPSLGSHTFTFDINEIVIVGAVPKEIDYATVTGIFTMIAPPIALQGNWYINDIKINSSGDVIRILGKTITFKFVKTAGTTTPTVTVSWIGPESGSKIIPEGAPQYPENPTPGTWQYARDFTYGTYTMELKATDGTNNVIMSVFGDFGEPPVLGTTNLLLMLGGLLTLVGVFLTVKRKR